MKLPYGANEDNFKKCKKELDFKRKIIYIMFLLNRKNRRKQRKYGEYAGVVLNIKNIVYFYEKIAVKTHSSTEEKCWNSKGYI